MPTKPVHVICRQKVFREILRAADATRNCSACTSFKRSRKFFKFLARVGAVKHDIMQDVVADFWEENPLTGGGEENRRNRPSTRCCAS